MLGQPWSAQVELPVVNTGRGQSSGDLVTGTRGWSLSLIGCLTIISRQPQGTVKSARVGNIPDWRDSGKNDSIRMRREASHNSSFPVKSSPTITGLVAGRLYSGRGTWPSTAAAWPGVGGLSPVAGAQLDGG